jgi:hypothetical protein
LIFVSERADSSQTIDVKKENKNKRPSNSNSTRPSESSNATNRPATVSFKEVPQKPRRSTTDSGALKVSFIQMMIFISTKFIF